MFRCLLVAMVLNCIYTSAFRSLRFVRRAPAQQRAAAAAAATTAPPPTSLPTPPTPSTPPPPLKNFYQVSQPEFAETMKSWSQPAFRAKQVWGWVYEKGVVDFNEMNDLPVTLRTKLLGHYTVGDLRLASEQVSKVCAAAGNCSRPHAPPPLHSSCLPLHVRTGRASAHISCTTGS